MLKKLIFAMLPLTLLASSVKADDDLTIDASTIVFASVEEVDVDAAIDVDALSAVAGEDSESEVDAIEACFRRCGYGHRSYGYGYASSCYNHCYNNYYSHCHNYCRPLYSYHTFNYCRPVYQYVAAPVYNYYWGCY